MSTIVNARRRFERLERVRGFPRACERCSIAFNNYDDISVIETRNGPMAVHARCRRMAQIEAQQ